MIVLNKVIVVSLLLVFVFFQHGVAISNHDPRGPIAIKEDFLGEPSHYYFINNSGELKPLGMFVPSNLAQDLAGSELAESFIKESVDLKLLDYSLAVISPVIMAMGLGRSNLFLLGLGTYGFMSVIMNEARANELIYDAVDVYNMQFEGVDFVEQNLKEQTVLSENTSQDVINQIRQMKFGYKRIEKPSVLYGFGLSSDDFFGFVGIKSSFLSDKNLTLGLDSRWGNLVNESVLSSKLLIFESDLKNETIVLSSRFHFLTYKPTNTELNLLSFRGDYHLGLTDELLLHVGVNGAVVTSQSNNKVSFRKEVLETYFFGSLDYWVFEEFGLSVDFDYKEPKAGLVIATPEGKISVMYGWGDEPSIRLGLNSIYSYK
jgi:hypothetical protein